MKIAVIGAGAIGSLVAGYLSLKGEDVTLVGTPEAVGVIKKTGLHITGVRGAFDVRIEATEKLNAQPDLMVLAVKTQDLERTVNGSLEYLRNATIVSTQNGVQADNILVSLIRESNIISSIVMFGATYLKPGEVVHNFEGNWIIGRILRPVDAGLDQVQAILSKAFPTIISKDIWGMKHLKIFVNANNCIPAILGVSMQDAFADVDISRISIGIWKEGLNVIKRSGVRLVSLPDFPLERVTKLVSLPDTEAAKVFTGIMTNLSKEPLYGSILQSIKRARRSEIDYINGEFVNLAKKHGITAPLNQRLVELVHKVEETCRFFTKDELLASVQEVLH